MSGIVERRLQTQLESNQQTVRAIADTLEGAMGAAGAGFLSGYMGEKGTKIAAIGGAIVTVTGALMDQPDVASAGRGAMCGGVALYFAEIGARAKLAADKESGKGKDAGKEAPAQKQEEREPRNLAQRMEAEHPTDDREWNELSRARAERERARARG